MSNVIYFPNLKASGVHPPVATGTVVGASKCLDVAPKNTALTPLFVSSTPATPPANGSGTSGAVTTAAILTAPANASGFILMNIDSSTGNIRWAIGRVASAVVGQQLQPARDTGFVACSSDVSICSEDGTSQNFDIQWVTT